MARSRHSHFLLDGVADWRLALADRVTVDCKHVQLAPRPGSGRPLADAHGSFGGLVSPRGIAVDAQGLIYMLEEQLAVVKRFDPCHCRFEVLACIGGRGSAPRKFQQPQGLGICGGKALYVVDSGNRRVQVFTLQGLALRQIWGPYLVVPDGELWRIERSAPTWTAPPDPECQGQASFAANTWHPWDIALTKSGEAFVSDYANGLIHRFGCDGRWQGAWAGNSEGRPPLEKPTHLAVDRENHLYVVQEGREFVAVYELDGRFVDEVTRPHEVKHAFCPSVLGVDDKGNLYIADGSSRGVHIFKKGADGTQGYRGKLAGVNAACRGLAFDRSGNPLVCVGGKNQVIQFEADAQFETEGVFLTTPLDSQIYQCQWHRVVLRAHLPEGTAIRVDTFTSNSPRSNNEIQSLPESRWSTRTTHSEVGEGDWDTLILGPTGRYLWLRVTLLGDGKRSPTICQIRVHYPRRSSLRFLPAAYAEDEVSGEFLGRFLSIFDSVRGESDKLVSQFARYLEPGSAPTRETNSDGPDFLAWLASWIGLSLDRHWPEDRRRELVRRAHRLYRLRGTEAGLAEHVEIYTGFPPRILEHFKLRRWLYLDHSRLGGQSALYGTSLANRLQLGERSTIGSFQLIDSGDPMRDPFHLFAHQFTVFATLRGKVTDEQRLTLERIIEMAKPAHTQARLEISRHRFRVGVQSLIGIDTTIGRYPQGVQTGQQRLGYDTVLSERDSGEPAPRIGSRSRIGSSTILL